MPSGNVNLTVEFGSAVPFITLSLLVTSLTVGASGAVVSTTVVVLGSDSLPVSSVAVAVNVSPPSRFTSDGISTMKLPASSAVVDAFPPPGNATVTVEPGSAWPVTCVASVFTSSNVGASGAVASVTVIWSDTSLVLPSLLAVEVNTVPASKGVSTLIAALVSSAGIVTVPKTLLLLSVTVTVEPDVPFTTICWSLSSTGSIDGAGSLELSTISKVFTSSLS